jgi:anaerobic ribonucleoside-triphosphate reductase activating protein
VRFVVWVQGCNLGCPGCYNPETHEGAAAMELTSAELAAQIAKAQGIEGVSISGGEPLQQPAALLELVQLLRRDTELSILIFSGYRRAEIERMELGPAILDNIDVLIDGRFVSTQRLATGLRGSKNQNIQLLSERYREADVAATPAAEIKISASGEVILTGVDPLSLDD